MQEPMIIDAWKNRKTPRMPVWLMRQAGRYLPEYRELRAKAGSFLTMCYTPELACEITLQPMRRFELDAAIIFSDILVVPQAMGQDLTFVEGEGPKLAPVDFSTLSFDQRRLEPVYDAIRMVRRELDPSRALIGFAGAPFTLASYMIDGGGGHDFARTKKMMRDEPAAFDALMARLTDAVTAHLQAQIDAGAQAVQVFESHAGQLAGADFAQHVVRPVRKIAAALNARVPVIGFARGAGQDDLLRFAVDTGITVAGVDHQTPIGWAVRNMPPRLVLQGNLDPETLRSGVGLNNAVDHIKDAVAGRPFVFNLGHGVIKETPPEHVAQLVERVHAV